MLGSIFSDLMVWLRRSMMKIIILVLGVFLLGGCGKLVLNEWGSWSHPEGETRHECDINPLLYGCPYGER